MKNEKNTDSGDTKKQDGGSTEGQWESIENSGGVEIRNGRESIHCLSIIGQIEGHYLLGDGQKATKYEHIIPLLVSIEESDETDGLLIVLNTMGGDVEAGLALAEMIASMKKPTVSLVLGGGHSIGVPLATSARRSFIVPSATMTIHPVRITGLVVGVPQTFHYFNEMQKRIIKFICDHSKADPDRVRELMMRPDEIATDVGSIIDGDEAVRYGIIDQIGGLSDAMDALREMIREARERTH
ncbi:MAG: ATP-dependent Clp protease proteolytic subunit [Clostridia bacterium]|nr:ATP-dependent Clp protease proteolytic subunit [Clostridia bacterium]